MIDPVAAPLLREWLRAGDPLELSVLSESMRPVLRAGDTVRIEHVPPSQLSIGDVLLVEQGRVYCLHRLVGRGKNCRTRGDAARTIDAPIPWERVLGRAVAVRRHGEWRPLPGFPRTLIPLLVSVLRAYGVGAFGLAWRWAKHLLASARTAPPPPPAD